MSVQCCRWCLLLLAVAIGLSVCFVILAPTRRAAVDDRRGWCCVRQGVRCRGGMTPLRCEVMGGFAFARDEAVCRVACAPSPPPHAAQGATP